MLLPLVTAVLLPEFDITAGGLTLHYILTHSTSLYSDLLLKATSPFIGAKCVKMNNPAFLSPAYRHSPFQTNVYFPTFM